MAYRVLQFTATIPAGTPQDTPINTPLDLDGWAIEFVDLEVPPGPAGLMGFYLANNDRPWIPYTTGEHLKWDDRAERFYATDWPVAGGWEVIGYNEGEYDHDVIVRFGVNPTTTASGVAAPIVLTFVETGIATQDPVVL